MVIVVIWNLFDSTFEDERYSTLSFIIITYVLILIIISTITYVVETIPAVRNHDTVMQVI